MLKISIICSVQELFQYLFYWLPVPYMRNNPIQMQAGAQAEAFNKWINRLSLDQQLAEAARVVEDMMKSLLP